MYTHPGTRSPVVNFLYYKQPKNKFLRQKRVESLSTYNHRNLKCECFIMTWETKIHSFGSNSIFQILRSPATSLLQYSKEDVTSTTTVCSLWQLPAHVSVYSHITVTVNATPNDFPATCGRLAKVQHACTLHENTRSCPLLVGIVYIHHRTLTIIHTSGIKTPSPSLSFITHNIQPTVLSQWYCYTIWSQTDCIVNP